MVIHIYLHEVHEHNMHSHILALKHHHDLGYPLVLLRYFGYLSDGALAEPEFTFEHEIVFVEMEQLQHTTV